MSRRSTLLSLFAVVALSALGVILAQSIPNAVFPEFVFHRAIILADSAELPASQMLAAVTRPLEEAAYGVAHAARGGISPIREGPQLPEVRAWTANGIRS